MKESTEHPSFLARFTVVWSCLTAFCQLGFIVYLIVQKQENSTPPPAYLWAYLIVAPCLSILGAGGLHYLLTGKPSEADEKEMGEPILLLKFIVVLGIIGWLSLK